MLLDTSNGLPQHAKTNTDHDKGEKILEGMGRTLELWQSSHEQIVRKPSGNDDAETDQREIHLEIAEILGRVDAC